MAATQPNAPAPAPGQRRLAVYFLVEASAATAGETIPATVRLLRDLIGHLRATRYSKSVILSLVLFQERAFQLLPLVPLARFDDTDLDRLAAIPPRGTADLEPALGVIELSLQRELLKPGQRLDGDAAALLFLITSGQPPTEDQAPRWMNALRALGRRVRLYVVFNPSEPANAASPWRDILEDRIAENPEFTAFFNATDTVSLRQAIDNQLLALARDQRLISRPPGYRPDQEVVAHGSAPVPALTADDHGWSYPRLLVLHARPGEVCQLSLRVPEPARLTGRIADATIDVPLEAGTKNIEVALPDNVPPGAPLRGELQLLRADGSPAAAFPIFGWFRAPDPTVPSSPTAPLASASTKRRSKLPAIALALALITGLLIVAGRWLEQRRPQITVGVNRIDFGTLKYGSDGLANAEWLIPFTYNCPHLADLCVTATTECVLTYTGADGQPKREEYPAEREPNSPFRLTGPHTRWPFQLMVPRKEGGTCKIEGTITFSVNTPDMRITPNRIPWSATIQPKPE